MSILLSDSGIPIMKGYSPENLNPSPDLTIVGNVITRNNPEAVGLAKLEIPYLSFPQAIREFAIKGKKSIIIAGTHGKTTTSSIIAELLQASGRRVHLGGNIGRPLLTDVPDMKPEDIAVLELSSFQLHSINIRPDIAVITNISPNHLDVHPNFEDYVSAKQNIFLNQTEDDLLVVNCDNPYTAKFANECRSRVRFFSRRETLRNGVFCRDNMIYISRNFEVESIIPASEIKLPGVHNVENYMAAFAAVDGMTDWEECRNVARTYGGVAHRL
jgi:UDP-N-acetylmuramoylalanine--D-glutamate ligase